MGISAGKDYVAENCNHKSLNDSVVVCISFPFSLSLLFFGSGIYINLRCFDFHSLYYLVKMGKILFVIAF